jgi:ABC-type uncharacterized transport system substrate-binding protein
VVKGDPAVGTKETNLARPAPKAAEAAPAKGPVLRLPLAKTWRIQEINYIESPMVEEAMAGLRDWLKESGLVDNRDYTLGTLSAQGDMAMLGSLFDAARTKEVDVFMVYSTPTLQVALKKAGDRPVVFNVVANPFIVGAGKNDLDHQPNVTGVYTVGPYAAFADMLQRHFPNYRKVGTMFCPAEVNSVANKDLYVAEATKRGITVEVVPANGAAELADAAIALCRRDIQAVTQIVDNLSASGFLAVARAAEQAKLPLFGMQDAAAQQGAAVVLSRDYREAGRNAAEKLARIMMGESPAAIPFSPPAKVKLVVSLKNARKLGVGVPEALLQKADLVIKE